MYSGHHALSEFKENWQSSLDFKKISMNDRQHAVLAGAHCANKKGKNQNKHKIIIIIVMGIKKTH